MEKKDYMYRLTEEIGEITPEGVVWRTIMTRSFEMTKEHALCLENLAKIAKEKAIKEMRSISPITFANFGTPSTPIPKSE